MTMHTHGPFSEFEMANRYIKAILAFMGIEEVETIVAERLDIIGEDVEKIVSEAIKRAQEVAKTF